MSRPATIALEKIRVNPAALRDVNRNSPEFLDLVNSIKVSGVLNSICVRELPDPEHPGEFVYGLVDGLHRFTASKEAGLSEITANITSMDDGAVEEAQIIANIHRIETKPVEYSKGLIRILTRNPLMTEPELAQKLAKSPAWLKERLNLVKLSDELQPLVDDGRIGLANAYALAKLPTEEQVAFADRAQTMAPNMFLPLANARSKEIRDAARAGRSAEPAEFTPVAHLRKMVELKNEIGSNEQGQVLTRKHNVTSVAEAFRLALQWACNIDPDSIAAQKADDDARKAAQAEAKEKAKAEREKKKLEAAQAALAGLEGK
jgi:ParB/RepB/Spo0J family partition protein